MSTMAKLGALTKGRRYSGPASKKFWERIAEIKNRRVHDLIYIAGCALQDHEGRVLQMLDEAEKPPSRK